MDMEYQYKIIGTNISNNTQSINNQMFNRRQNPFPALPPLAPSIGTDDDKLAQLIQEGFDFEVSKAALKDSKGDVMLAREILLSSALEADSERVADPMPGLLSAPKDQLMETRPDLGLQLMKNERTCDGELFVGSERTPVKVHKAIMACASPVLEKMYFPENDGREEMKDSVFEFKEIEPEEFKQFLEYCYTGRFFLTTVENGLKMYKLAIQLQMPELTNLVLENFKRLITESNALRVFCGTGDAAYAPINMVVGDFIAEHAGAIFLKQNALNELKPEEMVKLLKFKLKVSEKLVLERVIEYVIKNTPNELTEKSKRRAMQSVIEMVKLEKLGAAGITQAMNSGLFRKKDLLTAMLKSKAVQDYFISETHQY
eukprot:TRINITY_DN120533_c0_g1_i1.p1 TRINITY_DN120533_c0_g1~~TRINITY_DN120533_c0_g1_i1.p1  ORF type:complete len:372 (-),score=45.22 TRINITY_DN120533_c0_g1_i1:86-1201(-)